MNRSSLLIGAILLTIAQLGTAAMCSKEGRWALKNRSYFDPLIADVRAANISITALAFGRAFPFAVEPGTRRLWEINLGKEIPIFGCQTTDLTSGVLKDGHWGWGVWAPVSFHMMEDFKDESNPILNTDYRFSGMFKLQKSLKDRPARLGVRVQSGHESTHVGDEFILNAQRRYGRVPQPGAFERVNVSYEYIEYGASLEIDGGADQTHHLTFQHTGLWPFSGYYGTKLLEIDGRTLPASNRKYEPSFGAQWFRESAIFASYGPFRSADMRYRIVYDYNRASSSIPEDRRLSLNLMVGIRNLQQKFPLEKGVPDIFFRFYNGVNPHGMFRTQRNFTMFGVGIFLPM